MPNHSKSKAEKIRKYLAQGKTAREIANSIGVKPQYVHSIMYNLRRKNGVPKLGPGRPRKNAVTPIEEKDIPSAGNWTLTAHYTAPRLSWKQRFSALFTGRI